MKKQVKQINYEEEIDEQKDIFNNSERINAIITGQSDGKESDDEEEVNIEVEEIQENEPSIDENNSNNEKPKKQQQNKKQQKEQQPKKTPTTTTKNSNKAKPKATEKKNKKETKNINNNNNKKRGRPKKVK